MTMTQLRSLLPVPPAQAKSQRRRDRLPALENTLDVRYVRLFLYLGSILMSFSLGMYLMTLRHSLAYGFAALMFVVAGNSGLLCVLLVHQMINQAFPTWSELATTVNAVFLFAAPIVLYLLFHRKMR